jgi:hypothetical protein
MRLHLATLAALLALAGCGEREDPPASLTATVTVTAEGGVTSAPVTTVLAVEKPGKTAVVDAPTETTPGGSVSGRHAFPPGVTVSAIVAYYEGLFRNAGWTAADVRFDRAAGRLDFHGVDNLRGGAEGNPLQVRIATDTR